MGGSNCKPEPERDKALIADDDKSLLQHSWEADVRRVLKECQQELEALKKRKIEWMEKLMKTMEGSHCKQTPERDKGWIESLTIDHIRAVQERVHSVILEAERITQVLKMMEESDCKPEPERDYDNYGSATMDFRRVLELFLAVEKLKEWEQKAAREREHKWMNKFLEALAKWRLNACLWKLSFLAQKLILMLLMLLILCRGSTLTIILRYHSTNILIVDLLTYSKQINRLT